MVTFLVGKEHVHKWIEATGSLEIVYPLRIEGTSLYCHGPRPCFIEEEHLSRDLRFFVLSADEFRAVGQYVKWHDSRRNEQPLYVLSILFFSIGLVWLVWPPPKKSGKNERAEEQRLGEAR